MKKTAILISVLSLILSTALFAQVDAPVPEGTVQIIDDFENGNFWIWGGSDWDKYGSHKSSTGADLSHQWASQGKYSMKLSLEPVSPGASAVWFYDGSQDLTKGRYIVADFYNPYDVHQVIAFVVQVTDNWNWMQTQTYDLGPGKHTIVFDVQNINKDFDKVKRINITSYFYQENHEDFYIYVDNIRLIK